MHAPLGFRTGNYELQCQSSALQTREKLLPSQAYALTPKRPEP